MEKKGGTIRSFSRLLNALYLATGMPTLPTTWKSTSASSQAANGDMRDKNRADFDCVRQGFGRKS